jgi:hypothetical protein
MSIVLKKRMDTVSL